VFREGPAHQVRVWPTSFTNEEFLRMIM
jgi:hypothetical protein